MAASLKALIAYDGSPCADAALDDLKRAGLPGGVEALVGARRTRSRNRRRSARAYPVGL